MNLTTIDVLKLSISFTLTSLTLFGVGGMFGWWLNERSRSDD